MELSEPWRGKRRKGGREEEREGGRERGREGDTCNLFHRICTKVFLYMHVQAVCSNTVTQNKTQSFTKTIVKWYARLGFKSTQPPSGVREGLDILSLLISWQSHVHTHTHTHIHTYKHPMSHNVCLFKGRQDTNKKTSEQPQGMDGRV